MPGRKRPAGTTPTVKMDIARPTHAKVRAMADQLTREYGWTVTFAQAIDIAVEHWAADQVKEAGR